MRSANDFSVFLKYQIPNHKKKSMTPSDKKKPGQYMGSPIIHQRNPSITPTMGLSENQNLVLSEYF